MTAPNDPNSGGNNPNPGGDQGEKKFTQADLDRIVQTRLNEDRTRRSKDALSDEERTKLLNEIEGLKTQVQAISTEHGTTKDKLKEVETNFKSTQKAHRDELITRAIGDAARTLKAVD